jgi:dihydrofolate reductase
VGGVDDVAKLVDGVGGPLLVAGSGTLVHGLYDAGLVDEWRLMVFPTILGLGKRLFPDGIDRRKLKLTDDKALGPDGIRLLTYERAD